MNRVVFHIDLDAFFASCEERENPHFRGKPIVVGADPKNGMGRGVVSTANYIARKFGVHSAMPISQAWRLCPTAVFLPPNSALYSRVSAYVMRILQSFAKKYNGELEQVSIDEAYLDLTHFVHSSRDSKNCVQKISFKIRNEISAREKITASVGVGPNMLIAKIASDFQKPDGLTIVQPHDVQKFLDPLPIRKLPGIGPKTENQLIKILSPARRGGATVADLRKLPQSLLYENFGKHGVTLYEAARGIDHREVAEKQEVKSIGEEYTFEKDTASAQEILAILFSLTKNVLNASRRQGYKKFKTITLKIRYADFKTHTKSQSGAYDLCDQKFIENTALKLIWGFLGKQKIRLIGFRVARFC